ncbi:hypothetical protein [Actinoplanes couchii]|uniref:Uncharacterized protein n=1 Tax=Actinoplanes couchii TaxID=403638 RepID=A0ABQ3XF17_9ACTN|nr:hypothetical protein [Actinoplanes couchii]MDR6319911.1 hypothetical protein [Actinoplanes couchii]GID57048.1 hypothetical protein Aco03nite_054520 [Actinoplanes couchii]
MRNVKDLTRRIVAPLVALGVTAGFSVVTAVPAAASTIRDGWIQLCPWGNYRVHLEYTVGSGYQRLSPTLDAGADCWWGPMPSGSTPALIWMVGHFNTSENTFTVGQRGQNGQETFYNGRTGIGFAAQGTTDKAGGASYYYTY